MKDTITVKFVEFWPTFNRNDNKFVDALRTQRDVVVLSDDDNATPDLLFYSRCGKGEHYKYDCRKIYFTGENDFPDFNECDYAISFYDVDCGGRNLRYPLYMFYETEQAINPAVLDDDEALNREFCSLVMSNSLNCHPKRLEIVENIKSYKPIGSGGRYQNNVGGFVVDKLNFISRYKFNLALENSIVRGYVTEKILEPFAAVTVPIYWGSDIVKDDFNPESFINVEDYASVDSLMREIKRLDTSPQDYLKMLRAPKHVDVVVDKLDCRLEKFLNEIADNPRRHVTSYGEMFTRHARNSVLVPLSSSRLYMGISKYICYPLLRIVNRGVGIR